MKPFYLDEPIVEAHTFSRKVYLPAGASWTHARDGKVFAGNQWVTVKAPLDSLPIFLKEQAQEYLIGKI